MSIPHTGTYKTTTFTEKPKEYFLKYNRPVPWFIVMSARKRAAFVYVIILVFREARMFKSIVKKKKKKSS